MPKSSVVEARERVVALLDEQDSRGKGVFVGVRIAQEWDDLLRLIAGRTGETTSDLIRRALRGWLVEFSVLEPGAADLVAGEHGLTVAEADRVLLQESWGDDLATAVDEVRAARVGAASPEWDEDSKYARVTHGPNAGVVTQTPLDAA